jgi:hypothetical protein
MRSISGFNSGSLDGSFAAGQPISASALNKLAGSVDKNRPMMSNDIQFLSGTGGTAMGVPQQVYQQSGTGAVSFYQQFQLESVSIEVSPGVFVNKLKLAKGTTSFTQSNMPRVRLGGHNDQRQSWIFKTAVLGGGVTATQGTNSSTIWMESNGYYNITSPGTYYVTISKFDITAEFDDTDSALLNAEAPWVSIFPAGDNLESKIFSQTGPSEYVNKTNVQKMVGYDAMSTGLSGDWGNCHTTWFNPVKWGYSVKLIGIVTAATQAGSDSLVLTIDQHIVGPIDLQIPCLFNGTTLCNQDNLTETNDPYNLNKNSVPKWSDIVNSNQLSALEEITPVTDDWYQEFVGPADWTAYNYSYLVPASCAAQDDNACDHPFQFHPFVVKSEAGDLFRANVCSGMVNNLVPFDEPASGQKLPATIDFLINQDTYIYLRLGTEAYASNNPVFPVTDESDPYYPTMVQSQTQLTDTDEYCYILMGVARNIGDPENFTIDQTISGSVWAERLKIADNTAQYYWAGV